MTEKHKTTSKSPPAKAQGRQIIFLFILLFVALYIGFAGWTRIYYEALAEKAEASHVNVNCDDEKTGLAAGNDLFCTQEDYFAAQQAELMGKAGLYWIFYIADPIYLILSAFAFGLTGNLVTVIRRAIKKKCIPDVNNLSLSSGMGGLTAVMFLGAFYLFPSAFSGANIILKPTLEPFLCLFAGAYAEQIQKWFQSILHKFFNPGKEKT